MQTDKFTALVRNAVMAAQNDALAANHQKVTAMHLLRALLADDNVTLRSLVGRAGGDIDGLSAALDKSLAAIPAVTGSGADQLQLDIDLARLLQAHRDLLDRAHASNHRVVRAGHNQHREAWSAEDDPANPELILTARGTGYLFQRIIDGVTGEGA